ncbi:Putative protein in type-1 retrotransposable element R1DM [Araneus ventricosus]|uniref:Reverse transcriptase domain-containing protein n=1 Tax=Araneus ventricosus TaxID=182803 RepID=A0A4Y2CNZ3_ARAVE|nr:Putative protein in type-1 retrotransposable element R1DM [Araneus ventricosus]
MVALKIQTSSFPITIISSYSSPEQNVHTTLQEIQEIISSLPEEKIIIGADLNGHNTLWGYRSNDNRGKDILDFILANNLNIINKPDALPTFQRNNSVGWPDLILCSQSLIDSSINWEKGGKDQRLASSYRPISLLPTIGKVLEKLMTQRLTYHLESTNSLNDRQHDIREGKSVDTAINDLLSKIKTARRDGKHSLDANTCPVNINRLFHSLLQNRKVTLLTTQGRATKDQKQGCPQGLCSGPALWNLVANEILNEVWPDSVHIRAFADDFVLVIETDTNKSLVADTQSAITQFNSWCSENELAIPTEKTNYILFSKMVRSPKITWNGYKINRVKSFKYLGIHVDDRLNWLEHINKQGEKAIKMQQNLKRIAGGNWGISQIRRRTLYKTVIERMLAHGSSAWCLNPTFKMKRKLSSIQRPFLLHISGAYRTTPTAALQTLLGFSPLHMQLQFEVRFTSIYRLRIPLPPIITYTQPQDLEMKATGWSTHPSEHLKPNQMSFEDGEAYIARKDILNIFTDDSKTEH